jgi:hypothetical protein
MKVSYGAASEDGVHTFGGKLVTKCAIGLAAYMKEGKAARKMQLMALS